MSRLCKHKQTWEWFLTESEFCGRHLTTTNRSTAQNDVATKASSACQKQTSLDYRRGKTLDEFSVGFIYLIPKVVYADGIQNNFVSLNTAVRCCSCHTQLSGRQYVVVKLIVIKFK